jgi:hypothetical protein
VGSTPLPADLQYMIISILCSCTLFILIYFSFILSLSFFRIFLTSLTKRLSHMSHSFRFMPPPALPGYLGVVCNFATGYSRVSGGHISVTRSYHLRSSCSATERPYSWASCSCAFINCGCHVAGSTPILTDC